MGTVTQGKRLGEWEGYIGYKLVLVIKIDLYMPIETQRLIVENALQQIIRLLGLPEGAIQCELNAVL